MNTSRTRKYRAFRKEIKIITRKFKHASTSPFGEAGTTNYMRYERLYYALPKKWQDTIRRKVDKAVNVYLQPVVLGSNGQWYSGHDMDMAMIG